MLSVRYTCTKYLPFSSFTCASIYNPLNRAAVGLKLLVFEIFDVPQKVLLGIVSFVVGELDTNVVVVEVHF